MNENFTTKRKFAFRDDLFSRIKAFQIFREDLISRIWAIRENLYT